MFIAGCSQSDRYSVLIIVPVLPLKISAASEIMRMVRCSCKRTLQELRSH
ncbi:MAG: hypothetical protein WBM44_24680 [Waterburya sp.]